MKKFCIAALIGLGLIPFAGHTQNANGFESPRTVLFDHIHYEVHADGTYVLNEVESLRINNDLGVKTFAQIPVPYSAALQNLDIVEAYTTTKDGKRIDVAPDKILTQQSPLSANAPTFDDFKIKTIVFPAVEIGSTITFHIQRTQKTPLFPGAFSMVESFDKTVEIKSADVTVTAPDTLKIYAEAIDLSGGEVKSTKAGTKTWRWSLANTTAHAPEMGSVAAVDFSPRVAVTTFGSYAEAAKAYTDRSSSKAIVTPAIQKLSDEITVGLTDKREQAKALYQWVSKNIRYVAIFLDFGGVVPHGADDIVNAKYGDCKDHVTVLEALLTAKNIKSSPVLVNATNGYWLPKVAAFPGVLNHAISYLPEFDLYVDSTAQVAPFGVLPGSESGKSAIVAGTDDPRVVILPHIQAGLANEIHVTNTLGISAAGEVTGKSKITSSGVAEFLDRAISATIPKGMEAQLGAQVLMMTGQQGKASYALGDPHNLDQRFSYGAEFSLPNYASLPGPGAMTIPPGVGSFNGIWAVIQSAALDKRDFSTPCVAINREEITTIALPANMHVKTMPKPAIVDTSLGRYESTYALLNQVLTVKRVLNLKTPPICSSANYAELHTMAGAIARDLRTQIFYQ